MKWILYMMLFSTPAANITDKDDASCLAWRDISHLSDIDKCRPKFEKHHVWSLQTASQMEFANVEGCVGARNYLVVDSNVASTMTIRSWCICDDPGGKCPAPGDLAKTFDEHKKCEKTKASTCLAETRQKIDNFVKDQKDQTFSVIRLDPLPIR